MKQKHNLLPLITLILSITLFTGCSFEAHPVQEFNTGLSTATSASSTPPTLDAAPADPPFSVTFLDVGQADAAVIQCESHYMLIDGGNKDDSSLIYQYLQEHDISHLDLVIGTHADEDHIGGLAGAFHYADADRTLCSTDTHDSEAFGDFKKLAAVCGGGITVPSIGDSYTLGDAAVEILAVNCGSGSNDSSIVAKITYGDTAFLFTGDAEAETEQFLLDADANLDIDVIKVAHHGSADSSSADFLASVRPNFAVISVGADNPYGHPSEQVLEKLKEAGAQILRTDLNGDILFISDGTTLTCYPEHMETAETSVPQANSHEETVAFSEHTAYILNIRSKKFHKPECDSVAKMSDKNRMTFSGSREELLELGYEPCGGCKP